MAVTVRRLHADDADLETLAHHLNAKDDYEGSQDFTGDTLRAFLVNRDNIYLVGLLDGEVAGGLHGYVLQHPDGRKICYIDEVDTIDDYRRKGVATALMAEVLELAQSLGVAESWVSTETDNGPALSLYRTLGPYEEESSAIFSYKKRHNGKA